jgi:hypothetical protein
MDFLDPKKERRNRMTLFVGYCLVAVAIGIATLVLLYQSYGYNIDRKGNVLQNGLVFVSSQPTGAAIYLNDKRYKSNTDSRVLVPAGSYNLSVSLDGYRTWQRPIQVIGGDVQHFDYPFLFPQTLKPTSLADTDTLPAFSTQSPDRRWILTMQNETPGTFTKYDLRNPAQPVSSEISLPEGSFSAGTGQQTWTAVEWANDNNHVLIKHTYQTNDTTSQEYVLLNRDVPTESTNLTTALKLTQSQSITLFNNRVQQVYVLDQAENTLVRVNVADDTEVSRLQHVLAYKSYADTKLLYVSDISPTGKATAGQANVILQDGSRTITLRTLPAGKTSAYVLNLAQYDRNWYVAVGSSSDTSVYIYRNPQVTPSGSVDTLPAPWRRLFLNAPSYLSFSSSAQFLLAESGQDMVVYDFENVTQYRYRAADALDQPQLHATWMDGNRLQYVSGGKLIVFDYDNRNKQTLGAMSPTSLPFFAPNYKYVYGLRAAVGTEKAGISSTPLVVLP